MRRRAGGAGAEAARWTQFLLGLVCFGAAVALMIRSGLGLGPWDALHVGLHRITGISVGTASVLVGLAIVLASLRFDIRPGIGTLLNMVLIGVFIDQALPWIAAAGGGAWGGAYYLAALALAGVGTGMYIGAGLGKGPRDGLMVGLAGRTGWPIRRVRTLIEAGALVLGWGLGGPIGLGTLLFTFGIGPAVQWGLQLFGAVPAPRPDGGGVAPAA